MRLPGVGGAEQAEPVAESEPTSSPADQATVEALPPGTALLVVLRGPNTGARFLLDDRRGHRRPPPGQRHLPRRRHRLAQARRVPPRGRRLLVRDVGSLNGTYVNRERIDEAALHTGDEVQIGKFRLVSILTRPTRRARGRPAAAECAGRGPRAPAEHRRGARAAAPRTSPTSPSPRSASWRPRAGRAGSAPPSGYRKFTPRRRRAAALRPDRPARPLPAAAGHQGAPRRDRPRARAAGASARPPAPAGAARLAADPDVPPARDLLAGASCGSTAAELLEAAGLDPATLDELETTACCAPTGTGTTTTRPWRWPRAAAELAAFGIEPATCGRSAPPPTARSAWSSRSSRRCARPAGSAAGARDGRRRGAGRCACASRCTRAGRGGLSRAVRRAPGRRGRVDE